MRQLWWMCSGDHMGCLPGKTCVTKAGLAQLGLRIQKMHAKKHPDCRAQLLSVGARRESLLERNAIFSFRIAPVESDLEKLLAGFRSVERVGA